MIIIPTSKSFREAHPFVLPDGRRFASLYCAAQSAEKGRTYPITDESTGIDYDRSQCLIALAGPIPGFRKIEQNAYGSRREVL